MTIRAATLLTVAALAAATLAAPAWAEGEDARPTALTPALGWDGHWEGEWDDAVTYSGVWTGTYRADLDEEARRADATYHVLPGRDDAAPVAYSPRERALWLEDCQAHLLGDAYYESDDGRDRRGSTIGGLIGAVTGGLIGNRLADGHRLGGTLIGAGVGGLAGAVIGGAIDAAARRDRRDDAELAYRQCAAHLDRYEHDLRRSAHGSAGMVRVPITTTYRYAPARERVVEEWFEEEVTAQTPPPAPATKLLPVAEPPPSKRVRVTR